jgi:hypothetical protein
MQERADLPFRRGRKALTFIFIHARAHSSTALYLPKWVTTIPRRLWNFDFLFARAARVRVFCTCEWNTREMTSILYFTGQTSISHSLAWVLFGATPGASKRMAYIYIGKSLYPPIDCKWKIVRCSGQTGWKCAVWWQRPFIGCSARRNFILRCVALWIMPLLC